MDEAGQPTPPASVAPPTSSPSLYKVQKSSRRQTSVHVAPENVAKALSSIPELKTGNGRPANITPYLPHTPTFGNPSGPVDRSFTMSAPQLTPPDFDTKGSHTPQRGSCCSKESQPKQQQPLKQGSCCKNSTRQVDNSASESGVAEDGNTDGIFRQMSYSTFTAPQFLFWQGSGSAGQDFSNQPFMPHQTHSQNPAYLGGYMSDLAQMPLMTFPRQDFPNHADPNHNTVQPATAGDSQSIAYAATPTFGDPNHVCSCGDSCQCLGCASHPFNDRTKQYVQEMGALVAFGEKDGNIDWPTGYRNQNLPEKAEGSSLDFSFANYSPHLDDRTVPWESKPSTRPERALNSNFTNGLSSPFSPEYTPGLLMEPEEYYTLEYPVGLPVPCTDVTGSCQCGNDCGCSGCLTHSGHNGEPAATDNSPLMTAELLNSCSQQADSGLSRIPVLDNLPVSPSSPAAIGPQII